MKAIVNNSNLSGSPGELIMHTFHNHHIDDSSDKAIIKTLKEINATVKVEKVLKLKTRNGGFVAWPRTANS